MARFNGNGGRHGVHTLAGARPDAESEGRVWTPEQIARWQQQAHADPANWQQGTQSPPHQQPHNPPYGTAHGNHDPFAQPAPAWPPPAGQHADPNAGFGNSWPPAADSLQARLPSNHAFGRFDHPVDANGAASGFNGSAHHDNRGWDLAHYPGTQQGGQGYGAERHGYDPHDPHAYGGGQAPAHGGQAYQGWGHGADQPQGHGGYADHGYDAPGGYGHGGAHHPDFGHGVQSHHGYEHGEEAYEEPRRRPSYLVVTAALIGAIGLGGGLAYGYRQFTLKPGQQATPVVKLDKSPAKARPTPPSEREAAQSDKRFQTPLAETNPSMAGSAVASPSSEPDAGPRKVSTLHIARDGSVASSSPPQAAAPTPITSGVPGMVIEGGPRPPPPLRGPVPAETVSAPTPVQIEPPVRPAPRVADLPLPKAKPEPVEAPEPPQNRTAAAKKKPATRDDAVVAAATPAPPPPQISAPRASGGGFVVVLASRRSRDEAFAQFPDLLTKYSDLLGSKTPDVREADLTSQGKGVVYRLVVGPPGSKEAAIDTCNKLKSQGFTGCWATPN